MKPTIYNDYYEGESCPDDQLHEAIGQKDIGDIKRLVTDEKYNVKRLHRRTNKPPIIYAAAHAHLEAFKLLIDNGATIVDAITEDGFTVLDYCPRHTCGGENRDVKKSLRFIYDFTLKVINDYRNNPNKCARNPYGSRESA